jgi:soluble lytic murein transglycosylase-like protein
MFRQGPFVALLALAALAGSELAAQDAPAGLSVVARRRADGVLMISNNPDRPGVVRRSAPAGDARVMSRIAHWALEQGLDPGLVEAVVRVESAFDSRARSHKGAMGLMQLMPATARELGVSDAYDVDQNLAGGTIYLRRLLDRFDGDLRLALAGYNAGPEAVEKYRGVPPYRETGDYVRRVMAAYRGPSTITLGSSDGSAGPEGGTQRIVVPVSSRSAGAGS